MNRTTLILYTGSGCHLCEQARAVAGPIAAQAGWSLAEVSITGNAELTAAYGIRIPVLRTPDGRELGWPFSAGKVRRWLLAVS
ncbi:MAG: glutaredoxin family protein [Porticoccaceae bacterium]